MDLATKYTTAVKGALKEAAMGEPYDFHVNGPSIWDFKDEQGRIVGREPAWFIEVAIRAGLNQPDLCRGLPIPSIAPPVELFKQAAVDLLEKLRQDRDQQQNNELAAARAAFQKQQAEARKS